MEIRARPEMVLFLLLKKKGRKENEENELRRTNY